MPSGLAVVSFPVDPSNAPSNIATGELVSIVAHYEDPEGITTELIADRVIVLSFGVSGDDFGAGDTVLRVGVEDGSIGTSIVNAAQEATVSVVGITSAPEVDLPEETVR